MLWWSLLVVVAIHILSCCRLFRLFNFSVNAFSLLLLLMSSIETCFWLEMLEVLLRCRVDHHQAFLRFWLMTNSSWWCICSTRSSLQDLVLCSLQLKYLLPRLPLYFILNLQMRLLLRTQLQGIGYLLIIRNLKLLKVGLLHLIFIILIYCFNNLIELHLLHLSLFWIEELGGQQSNFFLLSFQAILLPLGVCAVLLLDEAGSSRSGFGLIVTTHVCTWNSII